MHDVAARPGKDGLDLAAQKQVPHVERMDCDPRWNEGPRTFCAAAPSHSREESRRRSAGPVEHDARSGAASGGIVNAQVVLGKAVPTVGEFSEQPFWHRPCGRHVAVDPESRLAEDSFTFRHESTAVFHRDVIHFGFVSGDDPLREKPRKTVAHAGVVVPIVTLVEETVKKYFVPSRLKPSQTLAEARMVEQRGATVKVRDHEERRPGIDPRAKGQGGLEFIRTCGRDVVDRDMDGHSRASDSLLQ